MQNRQVTSRYVFNRDSFWQHAHHERILCDFLIAEHYHYAVNRQKFRYFDALKNFLDTNPTTIVYLTTNKLITNFQYYEGCMIVNVDHFISFCSKIGDSKKTKERAKAFFGQHISLSNLNFSEQEKQEFIQANLTEQDLVTKLRGFSSDAQRKVLEAIFSLHDTEKSSETSLVSSETLIKILVKFITDGKIQTSILENLPRIQLESLKEIKDFVKNNLHQNETFFQNWIDENKGEYRKKRCLMFGIEYIDPKREGEFDRKRFDILATQNRERHVLIELKSPTAKIFEVDDTPNLNDGVATTYMLSREMARAIPQILQYKRLYENMGPETVERLGIAQKKEISECIIVIGQRDKGTVWAENFKSLCNSTIIKIVTYTDLIEKIENTITNLEENL